MTAPQEGQQQRQVPDVLRQYPFTTTYIVVALTVILALLIWDRLDGTAPSVCTTLTAILQGENR